MKNKTAISAAAVFAFAAYAFCAENATSTTAAENKTPQVKQAQAQSAETAPKLDPYEVTAMRFGDSIFSQPVNAQNISSATISESGLVNLPDILSAYGNVKVRTTGSNTSNAEISMRGFGDNSSQRILVLLDGQRLNRLDLTAINWGQIPLEEIENVEILRGTQTALYGNYAEAGVIKISTKKWNQPDYVKTGGFFGTYGEYSAYGRGHWTDGDYYASADVNYYHNSGYTDNSLNWSKSAGVNLGAKLSDSAEANFYVHAGDEYIAWTRPKTPYADMIADPTSGDKSSEYNLNYLTLAGNVKSETANGEATVDFGANYRGNDSASFSYGSTYPWETCLWTYSVAPRYRHYFDDDRYVEGGVDFYYDDLRIKQDYDCERLTAAPWLGGKYAFNDTFSLNLAGRYEYAMNRIYGAYGQYENLNGLAAQIGLNAKINDSWNVYFRFDQLYRYPAVDEMINYDPFTYARVNADLAPERGQNYEIGTNYSNNGFKGNLSVFYMHLDNEIAYTPRFGNSNIGETNRFGADVMLGYDYEKLCGVSTEWTFVSAKIIDGAYDGSRVPLVPTVMGTNRVWIRPVDFMRIDFVHQWTGQQYMGNDFQNDREQMPSFWTIGVTANFFICENLRAYVSLQNITDETYASSSYCSTWSEAWYVANGRTVRAGVEFKF